ncbi:MAG: TIM barrel protein [Planctomycetes bacterium]|nr:TIM barrel protein [Planctomycetota bacterium]
MFEQLPLTRREWLALSTLALPYAAPQEARATNSPPHGEGHQRVPLKIGIRAASMQMVGQLEVIKTAARIPGIMGVELQTTAGRYNLRDWDAVRRYKREAHRWAMHIPSIAGVWDRGVNIRSEKAAESLIKSIQAAELLGASVALVAFFRKNAPDMSREDSYGPIVAMLQKVAPHAADASVVLGLENSLSPADNKKLVDLVDHPAVRVYYDVHNMAYYGHGEQAVSGIALLGKERICMVHVKQGKRLLREPGLVDWVAAFQQFNAIGYDGWYIYETSHEDLTDCIEDTKKNNAFLKQHVRMPAG